MSRTITALFDTRDDAEAGRARLLAANIHPDHVRIHEGSSAGGDNVGTTTGTGTSSYASGTSMGQDGSTVTGLNQGEMTGTGGMSSATGDYTGSSASYAGTSGTGMSSTGGRTANHDTGIWGSIKNAFLPDEDRHVYEEGVRRGGFLLSADVDEDEIDAAVRALEDTNGVDIDERATAWRNEGWDPTPAPRPAMFQDRMYDNDRTPDRALDRTNDTSIPIIEESLVVGKREVERGGMRVRSYVTEVPVQEQVRLRQERVELDRRPVDRALSDVEGDAFRERSIEMTETSEVPVVGKTARVVEEVGLTKTADERVETINDTVRRTDVEVENVAGTDRTVGGTTGYGTTGTTGTTGTGIGGTVSNALHDAKEGVEDLLGTNKSGNRSNES